MLNFKTVVFFILKLCAFTQLSHSFSPLAYAYSAYVIPLFLFFFLPPHMHAYGYAADRWPELIRDSMDGLHYGRP